MGVPAIGLLNLNKPVGITSRRVVDMVQRLDRGVKVGHAGTLDPLASGVLVLCVGAATRLIEYVQRMPKRYRASFLLGRESATEDVEGEVIELADPPIPAREQIDTAARALVGEIQQRPPAYSALKIKGRRAYDLARNGQEVELAARTVVVHRIDVLGYEYPALEIEVECGSGTYIRSLGRDLAQSLGTMGVMSALLRTGIGVFSIESALDPESLTKENWTERLLPPRLAVERLPQVTLDREQTRRILSGQTTAGTDFPQDAAEIAAIDEGGRLIALLAPRGNGLFGPTRVLSAGK
ncbi:MAG: tRNA pseudouridine(55) synthase TruB [Rhodopirellula sp.]|nr:tRNA pseudouridine(55) synthase TruB [Rhodopirellula sp.]